MDRAVNLPEIVSRFAWFLWLCEPNEELVAFVFYPQDVVASSQVGRAWCGSLLPLLGRRIDDGEEMERWSIAWPNYLSPHCRPIRFNIATLIEYSLPNLLQEIEVCILIDHTQARQVLHRLTWSIPNTRDPNTIPYTDVIMALEPLSCLRSLTLNNFQWCFDRFSHLINRNTKLKCLMVSHCCGLVKIEAGLSMENFMELNLNYAWWSQLGLMDLIWSNRNLALKIQLDEHYSLFDLCKSLQECPKVTTLR
ncbi:MAG: hypothetical protein BYD32DRAFT_474400 [Podila humilis]|nr:MAG: hypothetical protein BYD32DRAFT_474400 [Podila humilis]